MNLQAVLARGFGPLEQSTDWRDAALYALALGMASDPLDADELPYVHEGQLGGNSVAVVPSYALTLCWLPFWQAEPDLSIHWQQLLHGEMRVAWHAPLPANGRVRATHRIVAVQDKGVGRGALMQVDKDLFDAASGALLARMQSLEFLRGDGGCGAWGQIVAPLPPLAEGFAPSDQIDFAMPRQAALLYRLASGDLMPIHADPAVARQAGFERPISHGLNNMGLACRAVLKRFAPGRPAALRTLAARFVSPGFPGDTIRVEMQRVGHRVSFRVHAVERNVLLLDRGECLLDVA